jgi:hypothetical protein
MRQGQASEALLVSASSDGILRWWNRHKTPVKDSKHINSGNQVSAIEAMIPSGNAGLITGHSDGKIFWRDSQGKADGKLVQWTPGQVQKLRLLPLSKNTFVSAAFISADNDLTDQLRWWRNMKPDKPERVPHERLTSWVQYDDDQIITGGDDGNNDGSLQLWTNGKRDGELVKSGLRSITSQIVLNDNLFHGINRPPLLMTGGEEGRITIWSPSMRRKPFGAQIFREELETGQKSNNCDTCSSIAALIQTSDGDLISGSTDGTIKVISPAKVVRAACELYAPLISNPTNSSERKAAQLCASQVPENRWDGVGWLRFIWSYLVS